ncbi:hypothetical protein [Lacunimicrobium album]
MKDGQIEAANAYQRNAFAIVPPRLVAVLFAPDIRITFQAEGITSDYEALSWKERIATSPGITGASAEAPWDLPGVTLAGLQRLDGTAIDASKTHPLREQECRDALLSFEKDSTKRIALEAGLWLWIDELDRSHTASQSREGDKTCDAWHTIMHRREGDFWNAKYWVRRVGQHPSHDGLWKSLQMLDRSSLSTSQQRVYDRLMAQKFWRGETMVDLCEEFARDQESEEGLLLRVIQQLEMLHLLAER